jgi:hypothetical protein
VIKVDSFKFMAQGESISSDSGGKIPRLIMVQSLHF